MYKSMMIVGLAMCAITLTACAKKYGAGCEKEVAMTEPWTSLGLPIDEDKTRVCASSSDQLKLRSYGWSDKAAAASALASALSSAGFEKDRCNAQACYFVKGESRVSVQPMDFKLEKKRLVTVVMNRRQQKARRRANK